MGFAHNINIGEMVQYKRKTMGFTHSINMYKDEKGITITELTRSINIEGMTLEFTQVAWGDNFIP